MTMSPAMTALVVAIAGTMFPAMAGRENHQYSGCIVNVSSRKNIKYLSVTKKELYFYCA